jgi:hypothetical protein
MDTVFRPDIFRRALKQRQALGNAALQIETSSLNRGLARNG